MTRIAVVDNEKEFISSLVKYIDRYSSETNQSFLVKTFDNVEAFLSFFKKDALDIIFLDINFPENKSGLDAASEIRKIDNNVAIIFITNLARFALDGYKYQALDYILKPIGFFDFKMRMDRFMKQIPQRQKSLRIEKGNSGRLVPLDDIYFVESKDHDLVYYLKDETISARGKSMKELAKELENFGFSRCGVSYLLNLKYCTEIQGDMVTVGNHQVHVSRNSKKEFLKRLREFIGNA